jgi:hypothetical protein
LSLTQTEFGAHFLSECARCQREKEPGSNFESSLEAMKQRSLAFLKELLAQVERRLPSNKEIFRGLSGLHPDKVLSQRQRTPFPQLPLQHLLNPGIENQYRKILLHNWQEEEVFSGTIPEDTVKFWAGILKYQDSSKQKPYQELATYALSCLTVPVSNAVVERIFSHVTIVKTKIRNRLSIKMLDAIIRIRMSLVLKGKCCKDFIVTSRMLELFNVNMYDNSDTHVDADMDLSELTGVDM